MKTIKFLVAALCCTFMSCGNQPQQAVNEEPADSLNLEGVEGVSVLALEDGSRAIWLKDNAEDRNNSPELFGDVPAELIDSLGISEGIPSSMSAFLLQTEGKNVLFDAGMGGELLNHLTTIGLSAEQIDYIYITHCHGDHIGGMLKDGAPVFPNAQVYLSKPEYDAWMNMEGDRSEQTKTVLNAYGENVHQFEFGETLPCGVKAVEAVGHTPGHTAYEKSNLLIIGDLFHGLALQKDFPQFCARFDMDKEASVASRKRLLDYAREKKLHMAGMHLPAPGFFE